MTYNLTALQAADTLTKLLYYVNDEATGTLFMTLMLQAVFFIMLMSFLRYGPVRSIVTSSFLCFILSGFLVYLHLINTYVLFLFFIITAIGVAALKITG